MELQDRQLVLDQLVSSEAQLLRQLDGLTEVQWCFRESPERWSIAENLEHLILFEGFIRSAIQRTLDAPAEPDKTANASAKEALVFNLANSRATKFTAREVVRPGGASQNPEARVADFRAARAHTIIFVREAQADLRTHFFPHIAFGDLDCYQWLVVLGQHTLRHVRQIEQIKADPAYPAV